MSIFNFGKKFNFQNILFLRCLNYPNQLYVPKNSSDNVKKSILKHENASFRIFAYKHIFVKTLVRISSSIKVNHLIIKKLYQKQNGLKFILEILVALHEN